MTGMPEQEPTGRIVSLGRGTVIPLTIPSFFF